MKVATRILLSLPLWLAYSAGALVLDFIGLFVIAGLALRHSVAVRPSQVWPNPTRIGGELKGGLTVQWKPRWAWVWCNEEDGVAGPSWYANRHPKRPGWLTAFMWSALRNPSNNLRFLPWINPVIDPARVRYYDFRPLAGAPDLVFTWQGPYSGLLWLFNFRGAQWRFWLGWKLKPEDRSGVLDTDMRKPRCGFAIQLKRIG